MSLYEISHIRNSVQEERLKELQQKIHQGLKDLAVTFKAQDKQAKATRRDTPTRVKYWMTSTQDYINNESRPYSPYYDTHKSRSSITESLSNQRTPSMVSSSSCTTQSTSESIQQESILRNTQQEKILENTQQEKILENTQQEKILENTQQEKILENTQQDEIPPFDLNKRDNYGFRQYTQWVNRNQLDAFEKTYNDILEKQSKRWKRLLCNYQPNEWPTLCPELMKYVRKGIPKVLRVKMWMHYSGAESKMEANPGEYQLYLRKADKLGLLNDYAEIIERDLHRTFPDNIHFNIDDDSTALNYNITKLRNVLLAFSIHSPRIGYCQSFNFLVGFLLLMDEMTEEKAFWLLTTLVHDYFPSKMFDVGMEGVGIDQTVLMMLIYENIPGVWAKLAEKKCFWECEQSDTLPSITMVTSHWFLTLFINILPIETVFRIWDCLLVGEGFKIIYQVALTIIKMNEDNIRRVEDYVDLFQVLQVMPKKLIDCHQFMEMVFSSDGMAFDLTCKEVSRRRNLFLNRRIQRRNQLYQ
ncbi:rab-GTPase-TBC domain-containing protein [Pilobolus umbonatus]|nr:rab-GTPase-TBC domain-containing protein [Pilobolus umbonatus]